MRLSEVSELAWRQLFPNPSSQTATTLEEFITSAQAIYAYEIWLQSKMEKRDEGVFNIPSNLLSEAELPVKDNYVDFSGLEILRSLSDDIWLQRMEDEHGCMYVRTTANRTQLLDRDDSLGDGVKTYFIVGKKGLLPRGASGPKVKVIYANNGSRVDGDQEIEDNIAATVKRRLLEEYGGRIGKEDNTLNNNSEN